MLELPEDSAADGAAGADEDDDSALDEDSDFDEDSDLDEPSDFAVDLASDAEELESAVDELSDEPDLDA
ncbi:MAG TPA: hypothetical protein VHX20_20320 [Terracidiphilus sp.]|nr:hypothetical protein [Terracidiphilus sp.]